MLLREGLCVRLLDRPRLVLIDDPIIVRMRVLLSRLRPSLHMLVRLKLMTPRLTLSGRVALMIEVEAGNDNDGRAEVANDGHFVSFERLLVEDVVAERLDLLGRDDGNSDRGRLVVHEIVEVCHNVSTVARSSGTRGRTE